MAVTLVLGATSMMTTVSAEAAPSADKRIEMKVGEKKSIGIQGKGIVARTFKSARSLP